MSFNPSDVAIQNGNFFGLEICDRPKSVALMSVPWDVTTSYRDGTSKGPAAMLEASYQVDLSSIYLEDPSQFGLVTKKFPKDVLSLNKKMRPKAKQIIRALEKGKNPIKDLRLKKTLTEVNQACRKVHNDVKKNALLVFQKKQYPLLVGGDHSTSLGLLEALDEQGRPFSILHLDAHADLRIAYEGFEYSHASIMNHALGLKNLKKLVQVGIRDYSLEEKRRTIEDPRIHCFFDYDLKRNRYEGGAWSAEVNKMIDALEGDVYISFDIDALDPKLCPNTGTPVPGGLDFTEVQYLFESLLKAKKRIVAADLVEVSPEPTEWNANVGARILFQLFCLLHASQN